MSSDEIQAVVASETHPMASTTQSATSSLTHVHNENSEVVAPQREISSGHGESALPEDKFEEAIENIEEDWENDPENPRNWIPSRKWTAVCVVSPSVEKQSAKKLINKILRFHRCRSTLSARH